LCSGFRRRKGEKVPVFARKLYFSTVSWYPYKAHAIQACGCTGSGCGLRAAKKERIEEKRGIKVMGEFAFQTLRESITSAIRSKILTGELQPGVKLAEQRLAEEFGSSRAPIREALRQLEQEGMVEYSRNVGCSVRRVKPEDAYEIYLLRANLEMTALRYFDCKFPEEDLHTLRGILEEMRNVRPGDLSQIVENDNRFHAVIVQRAGLPRLLKFWDDLNYGNLLVGANSGSNHETLAQRQNGIHTKLYEALASGDTETACRAVYAHYMEPMERMRSANSAVQAADEAAK
jgi:DNA-binding GntR family transcriptional regulator